MGSVGGPAAAPLSPTDAIRRAAVYATLRGEALCRSSAAASIGVDCGRFEAELETEAISDAGHHDFPAVATSWP
jgi:hypothetical protein